MTLMMYMFALTVMVMVKLLKQDVWGQVLFNNSKELAHIVMEKERP